MSSRPLEREIVAETRVAIVEDDALTRRLLRLWLETEGYVVEEFSGGRAILEQDAASFDVVCLDLGLEDIPGLTVLPHLRASGADLAVVVITAENNVETAVSAMRAGAFDYVTKPLSEERVRAAVARAVERTRRAREVREAAVQATEGSPLTELIAKSTGMRDVMRKVERVFASDVTVCIFGESGTGKELVARAIHAGGRRKRGPFVAINCAAIPESLQESELFGHERGAFTGAAQTYRGRFEQAEGGTLFLDELGEMSLSTQALLLRTLQERTIRRVGGSQDIRVNVRIVCATHRNLEHEVRAGRFREDLYFRLMVYPLHLPPLRERREDIPLLVGHFLHLFAADVGRDITGATTEAMDALVSYAWPGNVRELQNVIHRAMLSCEHNELGLADLPATVRDAVLPQVPPADAVSGTHRTATADETVSLQELERRAITQALQSTGGHVGRAAKLLGIGRATLYRRLAQHDITPPRVPQGRA